MTIAQLRQHAKERLDRLPPDKIRVAADFLTYLDTVASQDATDELLKMRGLLQDVKNASRQIEAGQFKEWRKVRKDV